jgi:hypothetical protein
MQILLLVTISWLLASLAHIGTSACQGCRSLREETESVVFEKAIRWWNQPCFGLSLERGWGYSGKGFGRCRQPVFASVLGLANSTTGRSLHETSRKQGKTAILVAVNEFALSLEFADELKADAAGPIVYLKVAKVDIVDGTGR